MDATQKSFDWNGHNLENYRLKMDPPCDGVIASLYHSHSPEAFRNLLAGMVTNGSPIPESMDPAIVKFLESNLHPDLTERDFLMFRRAYKVWKRDGVKFIYILFFRALPYTYMAEKPANVLRMTKLLEKHPNRRILETAQFIFDVMEEGWWKKEKSGLLTALKIRMLHSAIRYNLLNHPEGEHWNKNWGKPISQEDLIATNQVFSLEFIKGMEIMGHPLTSKEQEAWFHTWKVIGKIMGVQEDLLTDTIEEAWILQKSIYNHLFENDDNRSGIILGKALVHTLTEFLLSERHVLHMMREMIKDDDHPDLFRKIFEPTYGDKHPLLFQPVSTDSTLHDDHEHAVQKDHFRELEELHGRIKTTRNMDGAPKGNKFAIVFNRLFNTLKDFFNKIVFRKPKVLPEIPPGVKKHLIDLHLDKLTDLLESHREHIMDSDKLHKDRKIHFKKDAMTAVSGLVMGLLAQHFRPGKLTHGKPTQFRIPMSLKENWSIPH